MKTTKRLVGIAAATALAFTTAACSGTGSKSTSSDSTTLTYWSCLAGTSVNNTKKVLNKELKSFEKKNDVDVDIEVIGWNDLLNRLQTAISSGKAPDVGCIGNTWAPSLQATGAFLPFNEKNMKAIGGADKFVDTALATGGAKGKPPTSVPMLGLAYGLYYNKEMFEEAGLEPPQTWEEMVSDAKKLTKPDKDQYGMGIDGGAYTSNVHFAFIDAAQNGSEWFDDDGNPTFTKAGNVAGIKRYLDLMQKDKVVNTSNAQYDDATKVVNDFANGKVAMILNQNNGGNSIRSNGMESDAYGVVPFPAPKGGKQIATFPAGHNLSIFKNTEHKNDALKLVKFLTSPEVQKNIDKPFSALPVLKGTEPTFTDNKDVAKTFQKIYNTMSKPLPLVPGEDQFESTVGQAMNKMFAQIASGDTVTNSDIKMALKTAQQQVSAAG